MSFGGSRKESQSVLDRNGCQQVPLRQPQPVDPNETRLWFPSCRWVCMSRDIKMYISRYCFQAALS